MIEHNGKFYVRVSNVLGFLNDFGGIPPRVLQNKQNIGTLVHEAIEEDIKSDFPMVAEKAYEYFESYLRWKKAVKPAFHMTETRFYCDELLLTGKIDTLISFNDKEAPILVDFKTCAGIHDYKWSLQAHLYHYLLEKNGVKSAPRFLFIKLSKSGRLPKVCQYEYDAQKRTTVLALVKKYWEVAQ